MTRVGPITELLDAAEARDQTVEAPLRLALRSLTAAGDSPGIARVCLGLAHLAIGRRELEMAGELLDHGLAVVGESDRQGLARLLNARAALMLEQDNWPGALSPLVAASRMSADCPAEATQAKRYLGWCLLGLRDYPGAMSRFIAVMDHGDTRAYDLYGVCLAAIRSGDLATAHQYAPELDHTFCDRPDENRKRDAIRHCVAAELAAAESRWKEAWTHAALARPHVADLSISSEAHILRVASRASEELGERPEAHRLIEEALALPLGPEERFDLLKWAAELNRRDGKFELAVQQLDEAIVTTRDDGTVGRAVAQVLERSADGIHLREMELSVANEAINRAYASLDRLRHQLEERVEERTRALEAEIEIRRSAERTAVRANNAKSRFLANMSHELRTPLNAIIGYAEMLEEDLEPAQVADAVAIRRSGRHLLEMIDRVLDLTRLESGQLDLLVHPVDIDELLRNVMADAGPLLRRGGNQLLRVGDPITTPFRTDGARLRQVLANLIDNAAKFTEHGVITVGARRESDGSLKLWVADTGIGIGADELSRLFLPFEMLDPTATRRRGGSGLGLAICSQLADVLRGHITVDSTLGEGSKFTLRVVELDSPT